MNNQQQQSGEGENMTNTLTEQHVRSAIEMGLQSKQQTYQEFMESFLLLKHEDVKKSEEARIKRLLERFEAKEQEDHDHLDKHIKREIPILENNKAPGGGSDDELETEELGQGTCSPRCSDVHKYGGSKKFVQVDNFVEDRLSVNNSDDDIMEEEQEKEGERYVSSFELEAKDASLKQALNEKESITLDQEETEVVKDCEENQRVVSPLPGEAVDTYGNTQTPVDIIHQTQLDLCAKILPEGTCLITSEGVQEVSTNEVQSFMLDENFDYDNVVLSTKWDLHHRPPNLPQ